MKLSFNRIISNGMAVDTSNNLFDAKPPIHINKRVKKVKRVFAVKIKAKVNGVIRYEPICELAPSSQNNAILPRE